MRYLCLLLLVLVYFPAPTSGQWNNIAPNLLRPQAYSFGALHYKSGIVWAGSSTLWNSPDSGTIWTQIAFPYSDKIRDICFYDRFIGVVATEYEGIFLTEDGGNTWRNILPDDSFWQVAFNGSPDIIHAICARTGVIHSSLDRGNTWKNTRLASFGLSVTVARTGRVYVFVAEASGSASYGWAYTSSDLGTTWVPSSAEVDGDTYSMIVDSCDDRLVYLLNEDFASTRNGLSELYVMSPGSTSWNPAIQVPVNHFSGVMASTSYAIYAGTIENKMYRSIDKGASWKQLASPVTPPDTRTIAAVSENMLFVLDDQGNIWRTLNGGGDPVVLPKIDFKVEPRALFDTDSLPCNTALTRKAHLVSSACRRPRITSAGIGGPDSGSYEITHPGTDTIEVTFLPSHSGPHSAFLEVTFDNGAKDTIQLSGFQQPDTGQLRMAPQRLFEFDTLHCDVPLARQALIYNSSCRPRQIDTAVLGGVDRASYQITILGTDTIEVTFLPSHSDRHPAFIEVTFDNGKKDTINLYGFRGPDTARFTVTPQQLFVLDSAYLCQSIERTGILLMGTCPSAITSARLSGPAASDYRVIRTSGDTMVILFEPKGLGLRDALYEMLFANGNQLQVPLKGYGIPAQQVAVSTSDLSTDILGGDLAVPIIIQGLREQNKLELILHYGSDLEYLGSFSLQQISLDVVNEQWEGRSKLSIASSTDGLCGYAYFTAYSDSSSHTTVTFDSLTVPTAAFTCQYTFSGAHSTITLPFGCGISAISTFLRTGKIPTFILRPNPADQSIVIETTFNIPNGILEVLDALGTCRLKQQVSLQAHQPLRVNIAALLPGVYAARFTGAGTSSAAMFVIHR